MEVQQELEVGRFDAFCQCGDVFQVGNGIVGICRRVNPKAKTDNPPVVMRGNRQEV